MACVFLDLIILSFFMVFAAGFRHMIRRADPQFGVARNTLLRC
jgi:hypothetical protein